jgi:radical SAM superfamily enzyme YgiQ (UPF0313 family)
MKAARETFRVVTFAFGIVTIVTMPVLGQEKNGTVTFEPYGIIMHPGTKISKPDEEKLNEILKKYDDRLYRIETYENGKLIKTQGRLKEKELDDVYITQEIVSEVANAKAAGLSDSTVLFNSSDKQAPLRHIEKEKELIQELKPILQKYTKQ